MSKVSKKDLQKMPLGELIEKLQDDSEYIAAKLYSEFADIMYNRMKELKIKRIGLAKRLKKSPSYISQVLNREINPTLFTMMEFLDAIGLTLEISYHIKNSLYDYTTINEYRIVSPKSRNMMELKVYTNIEPIIPKYRPGQTSKGIWLMKKEQTTERIENVADPM